MAVTALASVRVVKSSWDTQRSLTPNHTQPSLNNKNPSTVRLTPSQNKQITPTTTPTTLKKNFNVSELLDLKNRDSTEGTEFSDSYLGYERWLPDPPAVKKPRSIYNAASLAYIGDCIYELYARRHFLFPPLNIEEYNDRVTAVVRCEAQDALLKKLLKDDYLSEKERLATFT
ncbi:PREDICTED: uncharacterized protein LOC104586616 isoform X2 [Nelumbo nucifera]|uniref:Uncharacterized protein LOC104586616 isoform X2 n=1 Tax=Nelumbo nucifera TaxID=4432 RepID=A0A1U7YW91_NELNU|nr:PREDICTED: uncharacterized protein LOC104586616 isoform X2 [Nelumbo nucifera]